MTVLNVADDLYYNGQDVKAVYQDGKLVFENDMSKWHLADRYTMLIDDLTDSNSAGSRLVYQKMVWLHPWVGYDVWLVGKNAVLDDPTTPGTVEKGTNIRVDVWQTTDRPPVVTNPASTAQGEHHNAITVGGAPNRLALSFCQDDRRAGPAILTVVADGPIGSLNINMHPRPPITSEAQGHPIKSVERVSVPAELVRKSSEWVMRAPGDETGCWTDRNHLTVRHPCFSNPDTDPLGDPMRPGEWRMVFHRQGVEVKCNGRTRIMVAQSFKTKTPTGVAHVSMNIQAYTKTGHYMHGNSGIRFYANGQRIGGQYIPPENDAIPIADKAPTHALPGAAHSGDFMLHDWIEIDYVGDVIVYLFCSTLDTGDDAPIVTNTPGAFVIVDEYALPLPNPPAFPQKVWPVVPEIEAKHPNALHVKESDQGAAAGASVAIIATLDDGTNMTFNVSNPVDTTIVPPAGRYFDHLNINGTPAVIPHPTTILGIWDQPGANRPAVGEHVIVGPNPQGDFGAFTTGSIATFTGPFSWHYSAAFPHDGDRAVMGGRTATFNNGLWRWDDDQSLVINYPLLTIPFGAAGTFNWHVGQTIRLTFPAAHTHDGAAPGSVPTDMWYITDVVNNKVVDGADFASAWPMTPKAGGGVWMRVNNNGTIDLTLLAGNPGAMYQIMASSSVATNQQYDAALALLQVIV